jgi:hypothetical protein
MVPAIHYQQVVGRIVRVISVYVVNVLVVPEWPADHELS